MRELIRATHGATASCVLLGFALTMALIGMAAIPLTMVYGRLAPNRTVRSAFAALMANTTEAVALVDGLRRATASRQGFGSTR